MFPLQLRADPCGVLSIGGTLKQPAEFLRDIVGPIAEALDDTSHPQAPYPRSIIKLNSRLQVRHRKRRYPNSVRSRRSRVAVDSQCGHHILLPSSMRLSIRSSSQTQVGVVPDRTPKSTVTGSSAVPTAPSRRAVLTSPLAKAHAELP